MHGTDKKSLASVILMQQGNKKAYSDIVRIYESEIYFLCGIILGFTHDLSNVVRDIFVKFFATASEIENRENFADCLYTYSIRICSEYVRKNAKNYRFSSDRRIEIDENIISAEKIKEIYNNKKIWENPDKKAISFFFEMIMKMPVQSKIVFSYIYYTDLTYEEISAIEGTDENQIKTAVLYGYNYLHYQAERARVIKLDYVPVLEYLPFITDYLSTLTKAPAGFHKSVCDKIGLTEIKKENILFDDGEEETVYHEIGKKKTDKVRLARIIINIGIIVVLIGVGLLVGFGIINKTDNGDGVSVSEEDNGVGWNGTVANRFESGKGTKDEPYIIADASQLAYFASLINSGNTDYFTCYFKLSNDIIINDTSDFDSWNEKAPKNNFRAIGYMTDNEDYKYFCGNFNGDGHTISGLYCKGENCCGLFGYISDGIVENLTLDKVYIDGKNYVGGIVGYCKVNSSSAGIYNCKVSGEINGNAYTGGIAGYCDVTGNGSVFTVSKCGNGADIICKKSSVGGIVGYLQTNVGIASVENCINKGSVFGVDNVGGIAGTQQLMKGNSTVKNCVNIGNVNCKNKTTGGIVGVCDSVDKANYAQISGCYYLNTSSDKAASEGDNVKINASALTAEQMKNQSNFAGFDFNGIWKMNEVLNIPELQ